MVASPLSKVPSIDTEAFTANFIELSSWVILMTGTPGFCAPVGADGRTSMVTASVNLFMA
jgi:hypothetical protein